MELYYSIMNILDYLALNEVNQVHKNELLNVCDILLKHTGDNISDLSGANDCGICDNWNDFISALKRLHESGDRV